MKLLFLAFVSAVALSGMASCNNQSGSSGSGPQKAAPADSAVITYYNITGFLRNEIQYVDSMPYGVLRLREANGKTDSAYISKAEFKVMAEDFLTPDFSKTEVKRGFTETIFLDETIALVTISYTAIDPDNELRLITVYLDKEKNDAPRTVYLEKRKAEKDVIVSKKMIWKAGKSCTITTTTLRDNKPAQEKIKLTWNDTDDIVQE